jgi:hypothetical protein
LMCGFDSILTKAFQIFDSAECQGIKRHNTETEKFKKIEFIKTELHRQGELSYQTEIIINFFSSDFKRIAGTKGPTKKNARKNRFLKWLLDWQWQEDEKNTLKEYISRAKGGSYDNEDYGLLLGAYPTFPIDQLPFLSGSPEDWWQLPTICE